MRTDLVVVKVPSKPGKFESREEGALAYKYKILFSTFDDEKFEDVI